VGNIFMTEDQNLRARKPAAIDDRSMIEFVGDNEIILA